MEKHEQKKKWSVNCELAEFLSTQRVKDPELKNKCCGHLARMGGTGPTFASWYPSKGVTVWMGGQSGEQKNIKPRGGLSAWLPVTQEAALASTLSSTFTSDVREVMECLFISFAGDTKLGEQSTCSRAGLLFRPGRLKKWAGRNHVKPNENKCQVPPQEGRAPDNRTGWALTGFMAREQLRGKGPGASCMSNIFIHHGSLLQVQQRCPVALVQRQPFAMSLGCPVRCR